MCISHTGAHCWSEAAHRGPVQRPAPVSLPGGEAPAGEAEDRGAKRADPPGRAQGAAVRGDLPSAEGCPRDRGQTERAGPVHSAPGKLGLCIHEAIHLEVITSVMSQLGGWLSQEMLSAWFPKHFFLTFLKQKKPRTGSQTQFLRRKSGVFTVLCSRQTPTSTFKIQLSWVWPLWLSCYVCRVVSARWTIWLHQYARFQE